MSAKHTPEPWTFRESDNDILIRRDNPWAAEDAFIAIIPREGDADRANAARIVSCVNACAGIADPEAVKDLLEAAALVYQEGFTDSYCGFCDRHAPKDKDGHIIGPLRHDSECIIEGLGCALRRAKEGT